MDRLFNVAAVYFRPTVLLPLRLFSTFGRLLLHHKPFLDGSSISAVPLLEQLDHPLTIARASRRVRGPLQRVPAFVARRDARVSATRQQERDDVLAVVLLHGTQRARMRIRGENSQRGRRKRFKDSKDPYRRPGQQRSAGYAALGVRVHPNGGMDEGREAQGPDLGK